MKALTKELTKDAPGDTDHAALAKKLAAANDFGLEDAKKLVGEVANQNAGQLRRSLRVVRPKDTDKSVAIKVPELSAANVLKHAKRTERELKAITQSMADRITPLVEKAVSQGLRAEEVAAELQEQLGLSKEKAKRIAVGQVIRINAAITQERHEKLGITEYIWHAVSDEHTRAWHRKLHKTRQSYASPPMGGGGGPKDTGHPGSADVCRCQALPVFDAPAKAQPPPQPPAEAAPQAAPPAAPAPAPAPAVAPAAPQTAQVASPPAQAPALAAPPAAPSAAVQAAMAAAKEAKAAAVKEAKAAKAAAKAAAAKEAAAAKAEAAAQQAKAAEAAAKEAAAEAAREAADEAAAAAEDAAEAAAAAAAQQAKTAAAEAAAASAAKAKVATDLMHEKVGGQLGTAEGGTYTGIDGKRRYIKFYADPAQAASEQLALKLYEDLGHEVPKSTLFEHEGKTGFASEIVEGKTLGKQLNQESAKNFVKAFPVDVLTANRDAVGAGIENPFANALVKNNNQVVRLDAGGTFLHRGLGGRKSPASLQSLSEWEGLLDPKLNPSYSKVAKLAGVTSPADMADDIQTGVAKIRALRDRHGGWDNYVAKTVPSLSKSPADRKAIVAMLEKRTRLLEEKASLLSASMAKAAAEKAAKAAAATAEKAAKAAAAKAAKAAKAAAAKAAKAAAKMEAKAKAAIAAKAGKLAIADKAAAATPAKLSPAKLQAIGREKAEREASIAKRMAKLPRVEEELSLDLQERPATLADYSDLQDQLRTETTLGFQALPAPAQKAIRYYTTESYQMMRELQAGTRMETLRANFPHISSHRWDELRSLLKPLEEAQERLSIPDPTQHGPLYRGIKVNADTFEKFLEGDVITHGNFSSNSTSYSHFVAADFAAPTRERPHSVIIKYARVKKGAPVMFQGSNNIKEDEVLLGKGRYKVTERGFDTNLNALTLTVEELD